MATPGELAELRTSLSPEESNHLQRLLGSWSLLADLSFSDLLLIVPVATREGEEEFSSLVVLGQVRPNNRATLIVQDLVGQTVAAKDWALAAETIRSGRLIEGLAYHPEIGEEVPIENIPVAFEGRRIGAIVSVRGPLRGPATLYERMYTDVYSRLALMVAQSSFPFPNDVIGARGTPRVGDGLIVLDGEGRVEFASPNAVNALHRVGFYAPPEGRKVSEIGLRGDTLDRLLQDKGFILEEVERGTDAAILVYALPLLDEIEVTGAVVLIRDVTDLRRMDRIVLSKDAAIREVHHRVKNNLQTISSLLALQGRRSPEDSARKALGEAERRVRSIALVHEVLSRDPSDQIPFDSIVGTLIHMAEDSVVGDLEVTISEEGSIGEIGAEVATPLAVIMAELLQNAVEHAFTDLATRAEPRVIKVTLDHDDKTVYVEIRDNGSGLPDDFSIEDTGSLGLSIVRDLVRSQLGGEISMTNGLSSDGGGVQVILEVPRRLED